MDRNYQILADALILVAFIYTVMKLEQPDIKFKESFIESARQLISEGHSSFLKTHYSEDDFQKYCKSVNNLASGIGLAEGYVSESVFWLIGDNSNFLGSLSIRHTLTPHLLNFGGHIGYIIAPQHRGKGYGKKILELGLVEAKKLNLNKVLLTCDNTNFTSAAIIEKNGGRFENELASPTNDVIKRRYWIDLSS